MSRTPPPNLRSLDARLRNVGRDQGVPERRIRRLIGVAVIGQLMAGIGAVAVKGATNIEVRIGTRRTRVSSDVDAVRRITLDEFRDRLAEALRAGWAGFTGLLVDEGEIATPAPDHYRPHRFRAKLLYAGGEFGTVTVEVAQEETNELARIDRITASEAEAWFAELGLPSPAPIPAMAIEHQIAQKLHACTAPDSGGWINDRAHDLVDLQLVIDAYGGQLVAVRDAAVRLFAFRARHPWPPRVYARDRWERRYAEAAAGLDVVQTLDEAMAWANRLIAGIDGASSRGN